MATTNLGIETIDSSDYVSPDPINKGFEALDALGLDYIVEKSSNSNGWWYRKWKSGRAECGIDSKNFGSVAHTSQWGQMYKSSQLSWGSFPITFKARPFVSITFLYSSDSGHESYVSCTGATTTTIAPKFSLVDPNSGTASNATFGIYVCGTWK